MRKEKPHMIIGVIGHNNHLCYAAIQRIDMYDESDGFYYDYINMITGRHTEIIFRKKRHAKKCFKLSDEEMEKHSNKHGIEVMHIGWPFSQA